jgi:class 3 adenylate cyclase
VSVCPSCSHGNEAGSKFCSVCGAAEQLAAEERKVVSVLFADLVGFTSRSEQMDPEDVRALLSPFYERLRAELQRFGGAVEKFIGDAVMALSGRRSSMRVPRSGRRWRSATGYPLGGFKCLRPLPKVDRVAPLVLLKFEGNYRLFR